MALSWGRWSTEEGIAQALRQNVSGTGTDFGNIKGVIANRSSMLEWLGSTLQSYLLRKILQKKISNRGEVLNISITVATPHGPCALISMVPKKTT